MPSNKEGKRGGRQRAREEAVHGRSQNRGPVNGSIHALPVPRLLSLASCLSLTHTVHGEPVIYYHLVPLTIAVSESGSHSLKNLTWAAMLRLRLTKEGYKC